ncbi:MAG TPA: hypothetical protein VKR59_13185 [Terriglobales bacterium]|nr:hypothetical protein [Terriglobales bacterium]
MPDQNLEPFVGADRAADFLGISRRLLLTLARRGLRGAYSLGTGTKRKMWAFRLSELSAGITAGGSDVGSNSQPAPARGTIPTGSPRSQKGKL